MLKARVVELRRVIELKRDIEPERDFKKANVGVQKPATFFVTLGVVFLISQQKGLSRIGGQSQRYRSSITPLLYNFLENR